MSAERVRSGEAEVLRNLRVKRNFESFEVNVPVEDTRIQSRVSTQLGVEIGQRCEGKEFRLRRFSNRFRRSPVLERAIELVDKLSVD